MVQAYSPSPSSLASVVSSPLSPSDYGDAPRANAFVFPSGAKQPAAGPNRHERYYFSDGNVIFLVEGILYNVHRYFFQRDMSLFSMMSQRPFGVGLQGLTDDEPICLVNVKARDFDLLLSILYPLVFGVLSVSTVDEWTAILDLAVKWKFTSMKTLAIKQLSPISSPIDRIILGRKHHINEWLCDAYREICLRQDPLTYEEGMRLGMEDVIKISAIMINYGYHSDGSLVLRSLSSFSDEELQSHFGLDSGDRGSVHDNGHVKASKQETGERHGAEVPKNITNMRECIEADELIDSPGGSIYEYKVSTSPCPKTRKALDPSGKTTAKQKAAARKKEENAKKKQLERELFESDFSLN